MKIENDIILTLGMRYNLTLDLLDEELSDNYKLAIYQDLENATVLELLCDATAENNTLTANVHLFNAPLCEILNSKTTLSFGLEVSGIKDEAITFKKSYKIKIQNSQIAQSLEGDIPTIELSKYYTKKEIDALLSEPSESTVDTEVSDNAPILNLSVGIYNFLTPLESLTIESVATSFKETTLYFTTATTFTATFPATLEWLNELEFETNSKYVVSIKNNIAVGAKCLET